MPRKSTDPEPEPTPTRRSSRLSVAPTPFDDDGSTSSAVKKIRRKKVEEAESLPRIDETSNILEPVTPKRERRKSRKVEDILDDDDEEDKQPEQVQQDKENIAPRTPEHTKLSTPAKAVTPIQEQPKTISPKKSVTPVVSKPQTPVPASPIVVAAPVVVATAPVAVPTTATATPAAPSAAPKTTPVVASNPSPSFSEQNEKDELSDGNEIVAIWSQCERALMFGWNSIIPVFAAIIFVLTLFGLYSASQFLAIVGIVYVVFGGLIIGSYALCMVPFILISRLFTQIMETGCNCEGSSKYINLCCRVLLFVTIFLLTATLIVSAGRDHREGDAAMGSPSA